MSRFKKVKKKNTDGIRIFGTFHIFNEPLNLGIVDSNPKVAGVSAHKVDISALEMSLFGTNFDPPLAGICLNM